LGPTVSGEGGRWSPEILIREGASLAKEMGQKRPTVASSIAYGLLAAARRNPLRLNDQQQIRSLVRLALFAIDGDLPTPDAETIERVIDRFLRVVWPHLEEPTADFNRWYVGPHSNFFKALAGTGTDRIDPKLARAAFLEAGWLAYTYFSQCLAYFGQAFCRSLPQPLTCTERGIFDAIYVPQAYLGGLPLVLIFNGPFVLKPVFRDLWDRPGNEDLIGAWHRILAYWSEMDSLRRQADRRFKGARRHSGTVVREITNVDFDHVSTRRRRRR
jgi:hypothetical protein